MTTVGEILNRSRKDVLSAAAKHLSRTDAGLRGNEVVIEKPDFGGLRDVNVIDLLKRGWKDVQALRQAGQQTLAEPGTTKTIELHKLTVAFRYDPSLDVYVYDVHVLSVPFAADIVIELVEFFAVVTRGCLTAVKVEAMEVKIEVIAAKKCFVSDSVQLIPAQEIELGKGIPLVKGAKCDPLPAEPTA